MTKSKDTAISIRKLSLDSISLLHSWFQKAHVKEHWGEVGSIEETLQKYSPRIESNSIYCYIAHVGSEPVGFIQAYRANQMGGGWWPNETEGTFGIDVFIGNETFLSHGLGKQILCVMIGHLKQNLQARKIIADPNPENLRAINCFKSAGFVLVGEVSTPDGTALLLENRP